MKIGIDPAWPHIRRLREQGGEVSVAIKEIGGASAVMLMVSRNGRNVMRLEPMPRVEAARFDLIEQITEWMVDELWADIHDLTGEELP